MAIPIPPIANEATNIGNGGARDCIVNDKIWKKVPRTSIYVKSIMAIDELKEIYLSKSKIIA
jgi:hypothetical protein